MTDKGVLQLLFDVRLLRDVLAPTPPRGPVPPAAAAWTAVESTLAARLDPIDWATYESHLWANEARCYQRCHVLYGSLTLQQRVHAGVAVKVRTKMLLAFALCVQELFCIYMYTQVSTSASDTNIMTMAPPCGRFAYLPISTPSAASTAAHLAPATLGPVPGDYSFDSLGKGAPEAQGSTGTLESLQQHFATQRLGALSSLLGDKAAEVTALAQQSLGEMSLPVTLTSSSGFFSNISKSFVSGSTRGS